MRPFNGIMLCAEGGEPICIIESRGLSKRRLKKAMRSEFNYYNNREGYGRVYIHTYTTREGWSPSDHI